MKIAVWRTGHEIADKVAEAVYEGLKRSGIDVSIKSTDSINGIQAYNCHVVYGILRGASEVFKQAQEKGKFWFNIDKGYFKPSHYDGYYRISLRGTQQTFGLDKLEPDYDRLAKLNIDILSPRLVKDSKSLICPPTDYVYKFYGIGEPGWFNENGCIIRNKSDNTLLQEDLDSCSEVVTFNSSVGWEALRQGIPVISDPNHSIVGAYQKLMDKSINDDYNERRKLFAIMSGLQLTLEEMKQGMLWPILNRLLSI